MVIVVEKLMDAVLGVLFTDSPDVLLVGGGADHECELTLVKTDEGVIFDELELLELTFRLVWSFEHVLLDLLRVLERDVLLSALEVNRVRNQVAVERDLRVGAFGADRDRLDDLINALGGQVRELLVLLSTGGLFRRGLGRVLVLDLKK